jgi:hypothetical protein
VGSWLKKKKVRQSKDFEKLKKKKNTKNPNLYKFQTPACSPPKYFYIAHQ